MKKITKWAGVACALACSAVVFAGCDLPDSPSGNAAYIDSYNEAVENMLYGKNGAWDNVKITYGGADTLPDYDGWSEQLIYTSATNRFSLCKTSLAIENPYSFYVDGLVDDMTGMDMYTLNSALTSVTEHGTYSYTYTFTGQVANHIGSKSNGVFTITDCDDVKDLGNNIFEISYSKTETYENGTIKYEYVAKVQRGTTDKESRLLEINADIVESGVVDGQTFTGHYTNNIEFSYGVVDSNEIARLYQLAQAYQG